MSSNHDDSFSEEAGGFKDRVVGAAKDDAGVFTGNRSLARGRDAECAWQHALRN